MTDLSTRTIVLATALIAALLSPLAQAQSASTSTRPAGGIAAIVNQDVVTDIEVQQRLERGREAARRQNQTPPSTTALRQSALDSLIDERVVLTYARENSPKVDEVELDRVVANVAAQNSLSLPALRERLSSEGIDYRHFRDNLRDQLMVERVREREVQGRIRVSDAEVNDYLEKRREAAHEDAQLNIAQVLVIVPDGAAEAVVAKRRAKAEQALARIKAGESFELVARQVSEDAYKDKGGEIGMRPVSKLPDIFVAQVKGLAVGGVAPELLRSGAGFHVLKLLERQDASVDTVVQTRSRHILLRPSAQLTAEVASRRLADYKRDIEAGKVSFEAVARENSEDGSAANGGDLGWVSPGGFVPEFETAMNALPINGISAPVVSRFGVHLIQVLERRTTTVDPKQLRTQALTALREQKYEAAFAEWVKELRTRAFIEIREAAQ